MGKSKSFKMIMNFGKPYKSTFFTLFLCIIITSFIGMLYPYVFGLLIDEVFYHKNMNFFKIIVISYCILYVGEQLLHLILNYVAAYFATKFNFDIRVKLYEKILKLKVSYLSNANTGDLITVINKDADQIYEFIHWNVFYLIANAMRLIIAIVFIGFINLKLMALMVVVVPLSVYISRHFGKIVKSKQKQYREIYGKHISWVFEILKGMREVQLFATERHVTKIFLRDISKLTRMNIKRDLTEFASEGTNDFITLVSDLSIYILSSFLILRGELTVGTFIASIDYFSRSNSLLKTLNNANMKIQNNMVSIDKVVNLLEEETEDYDNKKKKLEVKKGEVAFSKLSFSYNDEKKVLKEVSFSAKEGERISLVGVSGAGKSTLINLLLRFYEPSDGKVLIDGQDISEVSLKSLRSNIGVVQQDSLLFPGTLRYNITLGNPKASEEEIWLALEKASIKDFVKSLPKGIDTVVGKGGVELSGGQKQRISIARIFLKNPKILVFDEATSSLDHENEVIIKKACRDLSIGRTTLIIAHRLSTILDSHKVAVLKDGEIIAFDHHLKLLEECGYYRELFKEQYNLLDKEEFISEGEAV